VADHLSRMQVKGSDLSIDDYLRDDTLLKVTTAHPWYANLVNFMVTGYIPPGEDNKKLIHLSKYHLWDDPYLFKVYVDDLLRRCIPLYETRKILERYHSRHIEGTTEHSGPMLKPSRVDSSSQTCTEMPRSSCGDAKDFRNMGISIPETLCH
jgi:hypothetical protein